LSTTYDNYKKEQERNLFPSYKPSPKREGSNGYGNKNYSPNYDSFGGGYNSQNYGGSNYGSKYGGKSGYGNGGNGGYGGYGGGAGGGGNNYRRNNGGGYKRTSSGETPTTGDCIYGSLKEGNAVSCGQITDMTGSCIFEGKLFAKPDKREIFAGTMLYKFDIAGIDNTAISCKIKLSTATAKKNDLDGKLKMGKSFRACGDAQYDKYSRETVVNITGIKEIPTPPVRQDMAENKRVELHLHTKMSSMDGVSNVKDLVSRAIYWGHKAVAITDHGVVQAFPDAHIAAKNAPDDFKIIYGVEGYLTQLPESDIEVGSKQASNHIIILAKNYVGLQNLYKLITYSHTQNFYKKPRIPRNILTQHRDGLIIGSACELGELYRAILDDMPQSKIEEIASFYDYFEVMPLGNNKFMVENGTATINQLKEINKKIIALGDKMGKLVVATGDVHFMDKADSQFRAILQAGIGYSDADNQAPLYFRTTKEMLDEFNYLPPDVAEKIVIHNPQKIADSIDKIKPIPDETCPPELDGSIEAIVDGSKAKAKQIYGDPLPDIVQKRIDKELEKIIKYGFSVMYYIAQKLVQKSNSDGYLVGSRGSVGSSFIAFLCGITEVNALPPHYICPHCNYSEFITDGTYSSGVDMPNKECPHCCRPLQKDGHDIPFETFLGFEGDKEPDIDLNFSGDYQSTAHKFVEELFGEGYIFRAGTIATIASKTAYGFVKKYLEARNIITNSARINQLVAGCTGIKRTTGQHPGGVMVVPKGRDIHEFTPFQHPADDKDKNVFTTHFDYHSISGRLLKLDILGHDDPTVIRMLEDLTGVSAKTIPIDDPETMSLFTSTLALNIEPESINSEIGSLGVPEFGTKFVRQMLMDTQPTTFSELVRISGLSHGTNVWLNNAQQLIKDGIVPLKDCICTRDDIMLFLLHKGLPAKNAFDIMERVRKGKQLTPDDEELMKIYNVPQWYIDSCNKIQYMFPKAHAVAYVTMAFKIAWFKVHYPLAFYLTYLTVRADEFDANLMATPLKLNNTIRTLEPQENTLNAKDKNVLTICQLVREMFARGFKFLPIDLYKSDSKKFLPEDGAIRLPLNAFAGLGGSAAESIVAARNEEPFSSIEDLRIRGKVNKTVIELFREHGCLDGMDESNQISFFN
jgi:DNA polymerase-3 subunit alpha (Gram-positive type)